MIDLIHTAAPLSPLHMVTPGPRPRLSVIVKGLFELVDDGVMRAAEGPAPFLADEPLEGAPGRLRYASDLAPFKPAADVMLIGAKPGAGAGMLRIGTHSFEAESGNPVAFAPFAATAAERRKHLGTYDQRWVDERWPWLPLDFNPRHYCAAPHAMQIDGYLRGNERLVLDHLCAGQARLATQLPGLRPRCFLSDRSDKRTELTLRLDTLWVDAEARRAALLWRGVIEVSSEDAAEVAEIYLASEPLSEPPRSEAQVEEQRALALLKRTKAKKAKSPPGPSGRRANDNAPIPKGDAQALAEVTEMLEEAKAPKEVLAAVAGATTTRGALDALQALIGGDPAQVAEVMAKSTAQMKEVLKQQGHDPAILDEPEAKEDKPEEPSPWGRERVQSAAAAGESMEGIDLRRRDLSGLDLSGAKLKGALLQHTVLRGTKLYDADLRGALLVKADLSGAMLGLAKLDGADLTAVTASKVDLGGARLTGAIFDEAVLIEARMEEAQAKGASFRKADLGGAKLAKANLGGAMLQGAVLDGADARGAVLAEASLEGAHAERACLAGADLHKLRAGDGAFAGADLRGARADGSMWPGADLSAAELSRGAFVRANFSRCKLDGAKLEGARFESANFTRGSLRGADLRGANLAGACLDSADLTRADARKANLYEAELWRARREGLLLDGAHVAMTKLVTR